MPVTAHHPRRAGRPGRLPRAAPPLLLLALTAVGAMAATTAAPPADQVWTGTTAAVCWLLLALATTWATLLVRVHRRRAERAEQARTDAREALSGHTAEIARLVRVLLPDLGARLAEGEDPTRALDALSLPSDPSLRAALHSVATALGSAHTAARDARALSVEAARRKRAPGPGHRDLRARDGAARRRPLRRTAQPRRRLAPRPAPRGRAAARRARRVRVVRALRHAARQGRLRHGQAQPHPRAGAQRHRAAPPPGHAVPVRAGGVQGPLLPRRDRLAARPRRRPHRLDGRRPGQPDLDPAHRHVPHPARRDRQDRGVPQGRAALRHRTVDRRPLGRGDHAPPRRTHRQLDPVLAAHRRGARLRGGASCGHRRDDRGQRHEDPLGDARVRRGLSRGQGARPRRLQEPPLRLQRRRHDRPALRDRGQHPALLTRRYGLRRPAPLRAHLRAQPPAPRARRRAEAPRDHRARRPAARPRPAARRGPRQAPGMGQGPQGGARPRRSRGGHPAAPARTALRAGAPDGSLARPARARPRGAPGRSPRAGAARPPEAGPVPARGRGPVRQRTAGRVRGGDGAGPVPRRTGPGSDGRRLGGGSADERSGRHRLVRDGDGAGWYGGARTSRRAPRPCRVRRARRVQRPRRFRHPSRHPRPDRRPRAGRPAPTPHSRPRHARAAPLTASPVRHRGPVLPGPAGGARQRGPGARLHGA
ncbi:CvhA [Streptomyces sp. SPB78]|nr:CvhA [Streptomyces sp. SPB78]